MTTIIDRIKSYAGKSMSDRRKPTNPKMTARETIEVADYIVKLEQELATYEAQYDKLADQLEPESLGERE